MYPYAEIGWFIHGFINKYEYLWSASAYFMVSDKNGKSDDLLKIAVSPSYLFKRCAIVKKGYVISRVVDF